MKKSQITKHKTQKNPKPKFQITKIVLSVVIYDLGFICVLGFVFCDFPYFMFIFLDSRSFPANLVPLC